MPDPTKPLKIKDKKEFERRQLAYGDSLNAYNQSVNAFESLGYVTGGMPVNSFEDLPLSVWKHRGDDNDTPGWVHMPNSTMGNNVSIYSNNTTPKANDSSIGVPANLGDPSITTHIMPTVVAEAKGNKFMNFYPKPKQPVEYQPRPSYQQIPTKQPSLQSSLITDDQLTPTYIKPIIEYPKDVQRFTAGNYLESQGKPSGYVNYGDNKGQIEYGNGGIINNEDLSPTITDFYSPKEQQSLGFNRSYPYRTKQNPSYKNIQIDTPLYNDNIIHPIRIEKRYGPSNIQDDSSMNQQDLKPTFKNGGIHNLNRSNISETFDEMFVNKYK